MRKLLFIIIFLTNIYATEVRLKPPSITYNDGGIIYADFSTGKVSLKKKLFDYLSYGIIVTYTYSIELYQNNLFFDTLISNIEINKRLSYDIWSKSYLLESNFPNKNIQIYKNIDKLKDNIYNLNKIAITDVKKIKIKKEYYFKTRLTVKVTKLYSFFHVLFNFLSIFKYNSSFLKSDYFTGDQLLKKVTIIFPKVNLEQLQ